jgi:hypothetical protein
LQPDHFVQHSRQQQLQVPGELLPLRHRQALELRERQDIDRQLQHLFHRQKPNHAKRQLGAACQLRQQ